MKKPRPTMGDGQGPVQHLAPARCRCGGRLELVCSAECDKPAIQIEDPDGQLAALVAIAKGAPRNAVEAPQGPRSGCARRFHRDRILGLLEVRQTALSHVEICDALAITDSMERKSVRQTLAKLHATGKLEREGLRRHHVFRLVVPLHPGRPM